MFFFRVNEYLKYLILSGHRKGHGIHSPFIYDIVSRIFRNKVDTVIVNTVEEVRRKMITDTRVIEVNDLGAGSMNAKNNKTKRKVSDIARYSSVSRKYGALLSIMSVEFGKPFLVELGTSLGLGTMYLAMSCPDAIVHTIEGCPETAKIASDNFKNSGIRNIELHCGSFDDHLPAILDMAISPGLIFIDGNHRREPLLKYFKAISEKSDRRTVVIIDDIYLSTEMKEAWNVIKNYETVSVTIDLHRMGIVFFKDGINGNHFIVSY